MRRLPVAISIFTILFFILGLTGNILIADPVFTSVAFAKKGDDDKDKDSDKGKKGKKGLKHRVDALEQELANIELTPGPQGEQGIPGPVGPKGPAGSDGTNGEDGATGAQGPQGPQGETGATGAEGPQGATGPQGLAGVNGIDGTNGTNGIDGIDGADGAVGSQGPQGATGPQGPQGEPGSLNKSDLYTRSTTANLFAHGNVTLSQSCDDANDIALSGGCEFSNPKSVNYLSYITGSVTSNETVLSSNGFHKCSFKTDGTFNSDANGTHENPPPSGSGPILWPGNGHYYEIFGPIHVEGWPRAKRIAEQSTFNGSAGHLATVTSQDEMNFIESLHNQVFGTSTPFASLGGIRPPNAPTPDEGWEWVTGEEWNYTDWSTRFSQTMPTAGNSQSSSVVMITPQDWINIQAGSVSYHIVEYEPASEVKASVMCQTVP
jgi:hypothetical protein